eukprot:3908915-Rhodomonas_salina.1
MPRTDLARLARSGYARATRCPVLTSLSAYARAKYAMSGTDMAISQRACYAMSGTDIAYGSFFKTLTQGSRPSWHVQQPPGTRCALLLARCALLVHGVHCWWYTGVRYIWYLSTAAGTRCALPYRAECEDSADMVLRACYAMSGTDAAHGLPGSFMLGVKQFAFMANAFEGEVCSYAISGTDAA